MINLNVIYAHFGGDVMVWYSIKSWILFISIYLALQLRGYDSGHLIKDTAQGSNSECFVILGFYTNINQLNHHWEVVKILFILIWTYCTATLY